MNKIDVNYSNSKEDELEKKLKSMGNMLNKFYTYERFNFIVENVGKLNFNLINEINRYVMILHKEANYYYYNSDVLTEHIFDKLSNIDLDYEIEKYYGEEIKSFIEILYKFSENEIELNKVEYVTVTCLLLYYTRPAHVTTIKDSWYTLSAQVYLIETILDIARPLLYKNRKKDSKFFRNSINKLENEYIEELEDIYSENDSNIKEEKTTSIGIVKDNDVFGEDSWSKNEDKGNKNEDDARNSIEGKEKFEEVRGWGFDSLKDNKMGENGNYWGINHIPDKEPDSKVEDNSRIYGFEENSKKIDFKYETKNKSRDEKPDKDEKPSETPTNNLFETDDEDDQISFKGWNN